MIEHQDVFEFLNNFNYNDTRLMFNEFTEKITYKEIYYIRINIVRGRVRLYNYHTWALMDTINLSDDQLEYFKLKLL